MYFVKYGDKYLHDPRVGEELLIDLTLTAEENSCGFCDFTMYPTHPMYMKIKERDADNPVEVYDDDILLFSGFIYELGTEFYQNGNVKCKGELAYLTESIVRPYSTLQNGFGKQAPTSVDGFFEWLITQHNEQVKENKRFTVEINQGSALDSNNYIYRESTKYPTTWSELSEKLLDDPGGFIRIRHENGTRFIDYLSEWTDTNTQVLDFGKNLTDYTQTDDSESVATFIVPLGAKMSDTSYSYNDGYYETSDTTFDKDKEYYTKSDNGYSKVSDDATAFEKGVTYYEYYDTYDESNMSLTISSLEDKEYETDYRKSGDIVYCESAVQKYGWIGATYENTDITTKEALISRGILSLKSKISPLTTIEVKAIDMHLINPDIKPIRIGEYVRVRSKPHNLDSYFLCTNIDLDLNEPENSVYTLGTTFDTLTGQQNKRIKLLNANINQTYEQAEKLTEKEKQNAQSASDALKKAEEAKKKAESAIKIVDVEYYLSTSANKPENGKWQTLAPKWEKGKYIWSRTVTTDGNGNRTYSPDENGVCIAGINGESGADGKGIESIEEQYYKSTSATELIGGSWGTEYPGWENETYIWTRSVITYTDSTTSITTAICVTGSKGNTGDKGDDGRGIKSTEITYQIHSDGITVPTGEWSTDVPKTTAEKPYLWTRTIITYTDDTTSTMYAVGSTPEGVIDEIQKVLRYDDTKITLGRTGSNITLNLQNDKMSILDGEKDLMDIGLTTEESDGKTWDVAYISSDQILDLSTVNEMRLSATQIMYLKSIEGGIVFDVESYQGQGQPIKFYKGTNFNQGWTQNIPTYDAGDCDSIVDSGYYYIGSSGINRPENTNGWLECMKYSTNYCAQTYTTINGKRYTRYQQNGIWGKWGRVWQSYELFANESQAMNTAIGLNDTAANYDMLEIFYKTNDATQNSTKVYSPNGKLVSLTSMTYVNSASDMIIKSKVVIINGNVINTLNHDTYGYYTGESAIHNGSNPSNKGCDNVGIIRVLGWR